MLGVVQSRSGTSLPPEAFQCLRIMRDIFRQEFQGDETTQLGVLGLVDHAHPATAELLDDAVVRDGLADHSAEMLGLEWTQVNEAEGWRGGTGDRFDARGDSSSSRQTGL
jgi:hypothetical protein